MKFYDAAGQRISKIVEGKEEWYVRDASGNIMATYIKDAAINSGHLSTSEFHKYGSSFLGTKKKVTDMEVFTTTDVVTITAGETDYILNDHRGNNIVAVSDRKIEHSANNITIDYFTAEIKTATYYSSYGAISNSFKGEEIDKAFNGQKRSTEISETAQTAEFWEYNGDVGRRWNVDPVFRAYESPYAVFGNNPILLNDPDGLTPVDPQKHTVQKGDNLTKIAKQYNTSVDNLVTWNKIANRNVIDVNQVLTVSDPAVATAQTKAADLKSFGTYPNFGQSTGWTTRSSTHKSEFEITTATTGVGVGKASMQNFDAVYLQGGLLDKIKADPDMVSKENILVDKIKADKRYGSESFYMTGLLSNANGVPGVSFGGQRWTSANETWSSPNRNNPLLHKSTWQVAANELTWVLRNATVKYFAEVDPQGGVNIQYRLYDRLDLSKQEGRQEAYNNISKVLGFGYHKLGGGNLNLQTRAEWNTTK